MRLQEIVDAAVAEYGRLDIVCANAGILPTKTADPTSFVDAMDVDFGGVMNTVAVTLPHLNGGASIILTGSTAAMIPGAVQNPVLGPGGAGYALAKKFVLEYTEALALQLGPRMIRVNAVHPTNVNTNLLHDSAVYKVFRPDVEKPTFEDVVDAFTSMHAIPVPYVDAADISNAVLFLASDESRYITGVNLRIDAGTLLKIAP
jgi:NAD(P)-dependent dehydrogenase (short-subunit alcohol dehydrogenase family)